ncbi:DUF5655 domain-containing protein [Longimicrobium sp.]|uniref:DUF5655 domain-containing protein n=1 Tax=Longimicrobium sp. TaxID=2029185 RepID=UPI002B6440F6|nr:DUF5655 domain-containing protein [Longimicrobium sp.]HSU15349.1 DUF5655 domain-containing protein [Longimicrobium sp.]
MFTVDSLIAGKDPVVQRIYDRLIDVLAGLGPIGQDAKKTSIHLTAGEGGTAFAGVHPRRAGILLNVRTSAPIESPRVRKLEQVSRSRFHNEILLNAPEEVDAELAGWLGEAYGLSKPAD